MALTFIIIFSVTKVVMHVKDKQKTTSTKTETKINNPRGGSTEIKLSDDNELAFTILSCIADNEKYLVTSTKLKKLIFSLVKEKLTNESLVLTPNMIRFLALKLISEDQTLIVKIGNMVISSSNRVRLLTRVAGTAVIAFIGAVFSILPYAILMALIYFTETQNCGYNCDHYFQNLPKEMPVTIYAEKSTGHLIISENDDAHQVEIYIPSKTPDEVIHSSSEQKIVKTTYKLSRQKAREVKFSEFKKTDPVLAQFKDLPEPEVRQKSCSINDIHDIIDIRVN
jgi:hypothetical protein